MFRIIIDGYNLIFQCGLHTKNLSAPNALQQTRKRLARELAQRIDLAHRKSVLVVLDAKTDIGADQSQYVDRGITFRFARDFPDADSMIAELLQHHSDPKRLTIVSSDHAVQQSATRRGAIAIDSDIWFDTIDQVSENGRLITKQDLPADSRSPRRRPDNSKPRLSEKDRQEIQAEFESFDVAEIEAELNRETQSGSSDNETRPASNTEHQWPDIKDLPDEEYNPFPPGYGEDLLD